LSPPKIPYISNLTGTWITASQAMDPSYWGDHLRQTVRCADGLRELLKDENTIALEVGPGKGLSGLARQDSQHRGERTALATLPPAKDRESAEDYFLNTVGSLWLAGVRLNWSKLYGHEQPHRVALPTYPFERKRYWIKSAKGRARTEQLAHEALATTATERPVTISSQLPEEKFVTAATATVGRPEAGKHENGTRPKIVQQIIAQQLQISARQLELMGQQLELLRSGTGLKTSVAPRTN